MEIGDLTLTSSPIVPPPTTDLRELDHMVVSICSQPEQEMDPLVIEITSQLNRFWVALQDLCNDAALALEAFLKLSDEIQDFKLCLLPPSNLLHSFSTELVSNTLFALEGLQEELAPLARKRFRGELVRQRCCVCQWMGKIAGFKCAVHDRCHSPWQFNYKVCYHPYQMCEAA